MIQDSANKLQKMKARQYVESSISSIIKEVDELQVEVASQLDLDSTQTAAEGELAPLGDSARTALGRAAGKLEQVAATLQVAELHTAAKLAANQRKALQRILERGETPGIKQRNAVFESLFLFSLYLNFVEGNSAEQLVNIPPVLAPAFFRLASAGLAPFIDEYQLAGINTSWSEEFSEALVASDRASVRRLRKMYQLALIGLLHARSSDVAACEEELKLIVHVAERAQNLSDHPLNQSCWKLLLQLVDCLQKGELCFDAQRRHFFARWDRLLRALQQGEAQLPDAAFVESCITGTVYLLGTAGRRPAVDELIPGNLGIPGAPWTEKQITEQRAQIESGLKDALHAVTGVVVELLSGIKNRLGVMEESEVCEADDVEYLGSHICKLASVIGFCGFSKPAEAFGSALRTVKSWGDNKPSQEELLLVANAVLMVESSLVGYSLTNREKKQPQDVGTSLEEGLTNEAHKHLFAELRANIGLANRAINSYLDSNFDREHIANVGDCLHATVGGFKIIGVDLAADLMENCASLMEREYRSKIKPEVKRLESLADSLVSTEYLLHELADGRVIDTTMTQLLQQNLDAISSELAAA